MSLKLLRAAQLSGSPINLCCGRIDALVPPAPFKNSFYTAVWISAVPNHSVYLWNVWNRCFWAFRSFPTILDSPPPSPTSAAGVRTCRNFHKVNKINVDDIMWKLLRYPHSFQPRGSVSTPGTLLPKGFILLYSPFATLWSALCCLCFIYRPLSPVVQQTFLRISWPT